jgi:hypothetical protein
MPLAARDQRVTSRFELVVAERGVSRREEHADEQRRRVGTMAVHLRSMPEGSTMHA